MTNVLFLREQPKPVKHVSFHPSGSYIAASCTDGMIYVYSMTKTTPELVKRLDGLIRPLETDLEASSRAIWHPDGRALAAPTATKEIQVTSRTDWEKQRTFSGGHMGDITALAWSPNGAFLASAGTDRKIILWDTKTQRIVARCDVRARLPFNVADMALGMTTPVSPTLYGTPTRISYPSPLQTESFLCMRTLSRPAMLVCSKIHSILHHSSTIPWPKHQVTLGSLLSMASRTQS